MNAIGGWVGAAFPEDSSLSAGVEVAGTIEHYVTPRTSVRGEIGAAWWDTKERGFSGTVRPFFLNGNLVYNWEKGVWHPYVTAGAGLYHYSLDAGAATFSDNVFGGNFGGGVEYFLSRRSTVAGDVRYHATQDFAALVGWEGSFWTLSAGLKHYF